MNFKCDFDKEPCVIDEDLIYNLIINQGPKGEAAKLFKEQGIEYNKIQSIRLDFLDILQIDNLWMLSGLEKIQLSNNMIERIVNLETLTNLKELDLSFNNITVIENLENLRNLEVLTLFENKIKTLENLDNLMSLKVLSFGNNKLDDRKNIVYLRKFKNLKSLNLNGNPFCQQDQFLKLIFAYLPNLSYYEYRMISEEERQSARESFKGELTALEEEEAISENEKLLKQRNLEQEEINKAAFVEYLDENHLFMAMFNQDPDGNTLLLMADEIIEIHREYMKNYSFVTDEIHACGLQQYSVRNTEIIEYEMNVKAAKQHSFEQSRLLSEKFLVKKNEMFSKLKLLIDTDEDDREAMAQLSAQILVTNEEFQELCIQTWHELMGRELHLLEAIEQVNSTLQLSLSQLINNLLQSAQASFTRLRILEAAYFEATAEIADRYLTRLTLRIASNKDAAISPQLLQIMGSKESLSKAISCSHDTHLQVIDQREDQLVSSARAWLRNFLNALAQAEIFRNRNKIAEINHFLDSQKDELHAVLASPMLPDELQ